MSFILTRFEKGSELTHLELDNNLINLMNDKVDDLTEVNTSLGLKNVAWTPVNEILYKNQVNGMSNYFQDIT